MRLLSRVRRAGPHLCLILGAAALTACAGHPEPLAFENQVFYEYGPGADEDLLRLLEAPYDPLDAESVAGRPHDGVEILRGVARLSRPHDWVIRSGSIRPEKRFIEYVSPRGVVVSVYERIESPKEPWSVILGRYEAETKAQGGDFLGKAVPIATFDSQGRAYDVRRGVPAGKEPLVSFSREYLVRSGHRIVLVQIVRPRADYGDAEAELLHTVQSIRVL